MSIIIDPTKPVLSSQPREMLARAHQTLLMERWEDAEALFIEYLERVPQDREAMRLLAVCLASQEKFEQAQVLLGGILMDDPDYVPALNTMAAVCLNMGERDRCLFYANHVLARDPSDIAGKFHRAAGRRELATHYGADRYMALLTGRFVGRRDVDKPHWDGSYLGPGKKLLVYWEDGAGDNFQFVRFVKRAKEMSGAYVVLESQRHFYDLFKQLPAMGVCDEVVCGDSDGSCDAVCGILSCMFLTGVTEDDLPGLENYLIPDPVKVEQMRSYIRQVGQPSGPIVGVCWHGNDRTKVEPLRCVDRDVMLSLVAEGMRERPGEEPYTVVSLQYGETPLPLDTYADTAAAIGACDLVISTDTSVPHLAGAQGKPTWLVLPQPEYDWRWRVGDSWVNAWYPSMRAFRAEQEDKDTPLERVRDMLAGYDFGEAR